MRVLPAKPGINYMIHLKINNFNHMKRTEPCKQKIVT